MEMIGLRTKRTRVFRAGTPEAAEGQKILASVKAEVAEARELFINSDEGPLDQSKGSSAVTLNDVTVGDRTVRGELAENGDFDSRSKDLSGADIAMTRRNADGSTIHLVTRDIGGAMCVPFYQMVTENSNGTLVVETGNPSGEFFRQFEPGRGEPLRAHFPSNGDM